MQTWTRKTNAEAAIQKIIAASATEAHFITGIEARRLSDSKGFAVTVWVDNSPSEIADLAAALEGKATIVCSKEEAQPEPEAIDVAKLDLYGTGDSEETAACPHCGINHIDNGYTTQEAQRNDGLPSNESHFYCCLACNGEWGKPIRRRNVTTRQSAIPAHAKLFTVEGVMNPYRETSKSFAAFALIDANPGITRKEFTERGGRVRTLTEDVRAGRVRFEA